MSTAVLQVLRCDVATFRGKKTLNEVMYVDMGFGCNRAYALQRSVVYRGVGD